VAAGEEHAAVAAWLAAPVQQAPSLRAAALESAEAVRAGAQGAVEVEQPQEVEEAAVPAD
jgi:hypothetical protein